MAENLDTLGSFSIQDTMDMGMGNAELLNDLMSPDTASSNPEDVKPIIAAAEPPAEPAVPAKPKGKEIVPPADSNENPEDKSTEGQSLISNFLGDNTEDDEEEEDTPAVAATPKPKEEVADEGDDDAPQGTQFTALANDLFKLGVFNKDEDEEDVSINTPEEFLERFENEKKKGAGEIVQNFIGQFGEDYQNAFDAIFVKGVDPKEYFGAYNQVVSFAEMDLSEERNQEKIMKQALTDQGFDAEDVETEIERLKNYGDLENVAAKHHKVLVKKEATKLQQMEQKASEELQQKAAIRNQYINNVQTILQDKVKAKEFDGIPINPKLATELQDFLLVDKWKTPSGETLTDFDRAILDMKKPENHAMKVKVGLLLKMLEKDPTLSTIQKSGISKKTDQLFGEVARQVTKTGTNNSPKAKNPNSWFI
jgi:hypothetical protein